MDTFFLELEGELRVEETVTKVRALTLKNTLLSGDVAVTIGGKVRNSYLLACRRRDAPSFTFAAAPDLRTTRPRASIFLRLFDVFFWAPGLICADARPPVRHAGASGQVGRVRNQQQGSRVRFEHVRLHRRGRLPRLGEGSEAGIRRPGRELAFFSLSAATTVEHF